MSYFKYVSQEGALRFLSTWALRITPPDQFNDPFEMRPPLSSDSSRITPESLEKARDMMENQLRSSTVDGTEEYDQETKELLVTQLNSYIFRHQSSSEEGNFLAQISQLNPQFDLDVLVKMRERIDEASTSFLNNLWREPSFVQFVEYELHRKLAELVGVVCLSASNKHLLMWSHYSESHKGALLEFDEKAPCFDRRSSSDVDVGWIRRVVYSDIRPQLDGEYREDAFITLSLTKALEWAYEQEVRLIWPLDMADRKILGPKGEPIYLMDIPASALKSVTIGCKADRPFVEELIKLTLAASSEITIRVAQMNRDSYSLNYKDLN